MNDDFDEAEDFDAAEERASKSQLKRESAALQDLAAELADLPRAQLATFSLSEEIFAALCQAAALPPRGARKRQLKYVGGLFRNIDAQPIIEKLAGIKNQSAAATRELHKAERWRERLISGEDEALTELLNVYPDADRQRLRQLVRAAKKEAGSTVPPKSARLLFRYLRELFEAEDQA